MKINTIQHPKMLRLKRRLSIPIWGAVGLLESLWHLTAQHAKDGAIGKSFTNEDIANSIGWEGDPEQLVEALVSSGWLDVCEQSRLVVHDWHDHCPEFVKGNIRRMKKDFASNANSVPNSVGNSVPYSVPNSVCDSVGNSVGNLSTVLQYQDQYQDQANPIQEGISGEPAGASSPPVPEEPAVAVFHCQGKTATYKLTASQIADWQSLYPGLDVEGEVRKAKAWLEANSQKRRTASGMPRFIVNWLNRATNNPKPTQRPSFFDRQPERKPRPLASEMMPPDLAAEIFGEVQPVQRLEVRHG